MGGRQCSGNHCKRYIRPLALPLQVQSLLVQMMTQIVASSLLTTGK